MTNNDSPASARPAAPALGLSLDIGLPLLGYYLPHGLGASDWAALLTATALSAVRLGWTAIRRRQLTWFAAMMLAVFGAGAVLAFAGGDARVVLLKDSVSTAALAAMFLLSLLGARPSSGCSARGRSRAASRPCIALGGAHDGGVGERVLRRRHARGAEHLDALVVAVDGLAGVVDRRQAAVLVLEHDHRRVDVADLGERRVDAHRAAREHLHDLAAGRRSAPCRSRGSSCRGRSRPSRARTRAAAARGRGWRCARGAARRRRRARRDATAWCAGSKRRLKPIWNGTPAASTAASARSTSARSSDTGFSQKIALPASAAATIRSAWVSVERADRDGVDVRRGEQLLDRGATARRAALDARARSLVARRGPRSPPRRERWRASSSACMLPDPADPDHADAAPRPSRMSTRPPSGRTRAERSSASCTLTQATRVPEARLVLAARGDRAAELVVLDHDEVLEADPVRAARHEIAVVGEAVAAEHGPVAACAARPRRGRAAAR